MRLGYWAPMPPEPSGAADYARDLKAALAPYFEIVQDRPGDVNLYQLGNNPMHSRTLARALAEPGVVLLHDATLHHLYLGQKSEAAYREELAFNGIGPDEANELWRRRGGASSDPAYFRHGLLRRVVSTARLVVTHSLDAEERAAQAGARRVIRIPHLRLTHAEVSPNTRARWRLDRGFLPSTVAVGIFGYLRDTKRIGPVRRAAGRAGHPIRLVLSGPNTLGEWEASEPLEPVVRLPPLAEPEFSTALAAMDLGICLRHPSAGETSGLAIRFLSLGVPVLISDRADRIGLPCGITVPAGAGEELHLVEVFRWAAANRAELQRLGRAGRDAIWEHHDPQRVAERLAEVLRSS
jgi:glycosyltransferase involved in cell wall biosynthesis